VIESFLGSIDLFGTTYLLGLLIAGVLSVVAVSLKKRDHIFLGAAVAQASTLGVAIALWLAGSAGVHALESNVGATAFAVAASVATAWLAVRVGEGRSESHEAVTGWVFLLAGSVPVLMLADSPHGLEEVQRLLFSTLLSVSAGDLWLFVVIGIATLLAALLLHERLLLVTLDPQLAIAVGLSQRAWSGALALWLGLAVGFSIRSAGTLYTFGCLVLPALLAKNLCREVSPMLWVSPLIAVVTAAAGFVVSTHFDLPPAHTTVGTLAAALPFAWAWRRLRSA
jgi:ABC-type Mn2+/Zn2+ transport system permease subunit